MPFQDAHDLALLRQALIIATAALAAGDITVGVLLAVDANALNAPTFAVALSWLDPRLWALILVAAAAPILWPRTRVAGCVAASLWLCVWCAALLLAGGPLYVLPVYATVVTFHVLAGALALSLGGEHEAGPRSAR